jgi:hypothetical protein
MRVRAVLCSFARARPKGPVVVGILCGVAAYSTNGISNWLVDLKWAWTFSLLHGGARAWETPAGLFDPDASARVSGCDETVCLK